MVLLSSAEWAYIADGIAQDLRNDGRGREEYRPITIETGVVPQSNGSARVLIGGTEVLASVKADLVSPLPGRPHLGQLTVAVDCSPTADPEFEGRGGEEWAAELGASLEKCFVGGAMGKGAAVDLSQLCVKEGRKCWALYLDALLLSRDGNVVDACSIAFKAALSDLRIPKVQFVEGGEGDDEDFTYEDDLSDDARINTSNVPLLVTLTKVGRHHIVDASSEEESRSVASLTVGVTQMGAISGVTKRDSKGIDASLVVDLITTASRIGKKVNDRVDALILSALQVND